MYHFFGAITNKKGDALAGYYVQLLDSSGNVVPIYLDANLTPIINASNKSNMALVDINGNASLYVAPGDYTLNIYAADANTLYLSVPSVTMETGPAGLTGPQGPAGDVAKCFARTDMAAIAGPTAGLTRYLTESGSEGMFVFSTTNLSAQVTADPTQLNYVAPSSDTTGASGAWVRKQDSQLVSNNGAGLVGSSAGVSVQRFLDAVSFGVLPSSIAITAGGSGYAVGDSITLAQSGTTFSTSPVATVNTVSGGAITGITLTNPGVTTKPVEPNSVFTQASTSGAGTGATFTATVGPIAAAISCPTLNTGGGASNGNLFVGAEQPFPRMGGNENTFIGDKAGGGFAGATNANTAVGHNAAGSGNTDLLTTGGTANGSYNTFVGNDAGRNITGGALANTIIGQNAGRMLSGSYNVMLGAAAGTGTDWVTAFSGNYNVLIGFQVGAATLRTGSNNVLIGVNNTTDTATDGGVAGSNLFLIGGANGPWARAYNTDAAPSIAFGGGCAISGGNHGSIALGFGASSTGAYCSFAVGQDVSASANYGHARGLQASDRGTIGADVFSSGQFSTKGDAQRGEYVLRGSGSGTTAIRLTSDGSAAASNNIVNIPSNGVFALEVTVVATNATVPGSNICWNGWAMMLQRPGGATGLETGTKPTPLSLGTTTGADISASVDNTLAGLNISFTPPTGNTTNVWHVVARVNSVEVI